jgi:hypothetical protein
MDRKRLISSAPVLAGAQMRPYEGHSIGGPGRASIGSKGRDVGPEVYRLRRPSQGQMRPEPTFVRRRADSPTRGGG